jgi:hypothetical protein
MKNIPRKSIKFVINMLEKELLKQRESLKDLKNNKDCDLKCYENVVAKCEELEYNILEMEKLL